MDKEVIRKEITDRFNQLILALNRKDAEKWSEFYSRDGFLSAIAGTDQYDTRDEWVDVITRYFSIRERQHVESLDVRVSELATGLALMTSREKSEMWLTNGGNIQADHVFTMIWNKEPDGWKIVHSHESWQDRPSV